MKPDPARLVRWLWAALIAMVLGLAGLCAVAHMAILDIGEMNALVAQDTAPSVVALQGMTVSLSRLQSVLRQSLSPSADLATLRTRAAEERGAFDEDTRRWLTLPIDPGERELMDEAKLRIAQFDGVARRVLSATPPRSPAPPATPATRADVLRAELDAAVNDLHDVIARASRLNADLASRAIDVADRVGRRLLPAAIGVEAVSVVLAAVALVAASRVSRTEAALAERRILERKNAELEAFSARVAHDVLSPLMTVSMAVGLAEHRLSAPGDERVHTMLARAASSLERVRQVVSDLLAFARAAATPPPGAMTEVAPLLRGLVDDLGPVAASEGVDLRLGDAAPGRVRCAAGILASIVTNLVQNAIRHADKDEHRVDVRAVDAGAEIRFEVEDSGPGVPLEDRERIFEPYVRATDQGAGLGLGLATVKRLAESHGGHVGVCTPGGRLHGALFWVTLPAV